MGAADEDIDETELLEQDEPDPEDLAALQSSEPGAAAPSNTKSFEGIRDTGWFPPDCAVAVGASHVVVAVNSEFKIYDKSGNYKKKWNFNKFFKRSNDYKVFDPKVIYDHYSRRYAVICAVVKDSPKGSWIAIGVTKTADPTGGWWYWMLDITKNGNTKTDNWGDYPQLGFDTQCFYITTNQFKFNGGFQYAKLRILNKSQLYSGGSVKWYDYWDLKNPDGSKAMTVQPCAHFRGTGGNPPGYLVNALWPSSTKKHLTLWTISNPKGYWTGGSPSLSKASISCRSYNFPTRCHSKRND